MFYFTNEYTVEEIKEIETALAKRLNRSLDFFKVEQRLFAFEENQEITSTAWGDTVQTLIEKLIEKFS